MKRLSVIFLLVVAVLTVVGLRADQGMWMPQQIPQLAAKLKSLGFQGDPQAFADLTGQPMGAVVSLGGCTASFVSPDGLIVTNHHCVTGALQFNSTPQRDLLTNGYLAATRADELPAGPGSRVFVTTRVSDVTQAITGGLDPKLTDRQRYDAIDVRLKERVAACEKQAAALQRAVVLRGLEVLRDRAAGDSRRPPGLRARRGYRRSSAARPTTGAGRATRATGASTAPTSARTGSRPRSPRTTCPTSRSTGSRWPPRA